MISKAQDSIEIEAYAQFQNYSIDNVIIKGFSDSLFIKDITAFEFEGKQYSFRKVRRRVQLLQDSNLKYEMGGGIRGEIFDWKGNKIGKTSKKNNKSLEDFEGENLALIKLAPNKNGVQINIILSKDDPELALLLVYHRLEYYRNKKIADETVFFVFF